MGGGLAAAVLAGLMLFASACGGGSGAANADTSGAPADAAADATAPASDQAGTTQPNSATTSGTPAGSVPDSQRVAETRSHIVRLATTQLDGQEFDPASVAGEDVLLWFWAPW